jgi:hypothetical protein
VLLAGNQIDIMASVDSSERKFFCEFRDCGRSYSNVLALRKHQRTEGHGRVETGKLVCPVAECSRW